jgi:hypothetical protein
MLELLPKDISVIILLKFSLKKLLYFRLVCKKWRIIIENLDKNGDFIEKYWKYGYNWNNIMNYFRSSYFIGIAKSNKTISYNFKDFGIDTKTRKSDVFIESILDFIIFTTSQEVIIIKAEIDKEIIVDHIKLDNVGSGTLTRIDIYTFAFGSWIVDNGSQSSFAYIFDFYKGNYKRFIFHFSGWEYFRILNDRNSFNLDSETSPIIGINSHKRDCSLYLIGKLLHESEKIYFFERNSEMHINLDKKIVCVESSKEPCLILGHNIWYFSREKILTEAIYKNNTIEIKKLWKNEDWTNSKLILQIFNEICIINMGSDIFTIEFYFIILNKKYKIQSPSLKFYLDIPLTYTNQYFIIRRDNYKWCLIRNIQQFELSFSLQEITIAKFCSLYFYPYYVDNNRFIFKSVKCVFNPIEIQNNRNYNTLRSLISFQTKKPIKKSKSFLNLFKKLKLKTKSKTEESFKLEKDLNIYDFEETDGNYLIDIPELSISSIFNYGIAYIEDDSLSIVYY